MALGGAATPAGDNLREIQFWLFVETQETKHAGALKTASSRLD
jgi:hypothetical protein